MRILMSGASGFIGGAIQRRLTNGGHEVVPLVRGSTASRTGVAWDPARGEIDAAGVEGFDAVIHLGGEGIANKRWSEEQKRRIVSSRVDGTRLLVKTLVACAKRPKVLLSASATGFYGARGDEPLDEGSAMGEGFLAETCRDWEAETRDALYADIRVAQTRFGIVLGPEGGALKKMLLPFKLGVGGRLGDGRQFMSWIDHEDVVRAIEHLLLTDELAGPVNIVAPHPVTNLEFTKTLGKVLRRPTLFPVPAFALRLALGEMAEPLLLTGQRVAPKRLLESGFKFEAPTLEESLRRQLGR